MLRFSEVAVNASFWVKCLFHMVEISKKNYFYEGITLQDKFWKIQKNSVKIWNSRWFVFGLKNNIVYWFFSNKN